MVGHPLEHLELNLLNEGGLLSDDRFCQQQSAGDVKQVVRGDPHANGAQMGGGECPGKHLLVGGVGFKFGAIGCLRPAAEARFHPLGLHVGSLHEPNGHGRTTGRDTSQRPGGDLTLNALRIGDVGLQGDACGRVFQPRPVEGPHESGRGQFEIAVLLHVEVDELGNAGPVEPRVPQVQCFAIQRFQSIAERAERLFAGVRGDLREQRADFDRDHFHFGKLQGREILVESVRRLRFSQQRVAQEVDVHPQPFGPPLAEVPGQVFWLGGEHDIGGFLPHLLLNERN